MTRWSVQRCVAVTALAALAVIAALQAERLVDVAIVRGTSMTPTLLDGQLLIIDKTSSPRAGDIVVFRPPDDWHSNHDVLVKRMVAGGGSFVACCGQDGSLIVDSQQVGSRYIRGDARLPPFDRFVPGGYFWAMGDNRDRSDDSATHLNSRERGAVPTDHILGVVRDF